MQQAWLVYNPTAGRIPMKSFVYRAAQILRESGWSVRVVATRSGEHAVELARQAAGEKVDALFAVGGDGTVSQAAAGLAGSSTALGILPAGTQNVMALELGLRPLDWNRWWAMDENVRALIQAPIFNVDLGICNRRPFLLSAGLGLDALAIRNLEPRRRFDKFLAIPEYAAAIALNAARWGGMDLKVHADGRLVEGHYILAVATNVRSYLGGLAQISPQAHMDDGQLDLWLFGGGTVQDAFRHSFGMMAGSHLTAEDTLCVPCRSAMIDATEPISLQTDGEPFGTARRIEISVLAHSLRLIMPHKSPSLLSRLPQNTTHYTQTMP